jgi:hypothetical protein
MVVPKDYNGAKTFLSARDAGVIIQP